MPNLLYPGTRILRESLKMSYLHPAFRDGHAHPLFAGRESLGPRVDGLNSIQKIVEVVSKYAHENPEQYWIVGGAYDRSLERTFLASWLDIACKDRPVVLHASDHHTIWVNSKALELAGLQDSAPDVSPGFCDVDESGKPTGTLRESGAMDLVLSKIPALSMEQELRALDWAQEQMLAAGIVQVQDAWIEKGMTEIYLEALKRDKLKVRVNLAARITPENFYGDFQYFEDMRKRVRETDSDLLTFNTAKFFADGVLGSGTAAVLEPYVHNHSFGEPVWDTAELESATKHYAAAGYQLHIHAIGDRGVRTALDVIEKAPRTNFPAVIAHAELVDTQDIPRFAKLGVVANMQPLWARPDGMLLSCEPNLGRERLDRLYRMRDLLDSGATLSFGSDWPVSSVRPLEGIQAAVTRSYLGSDSWVPQQCISVEEALTAYTSKVLIQLNTTDFDECVHLSADPRETEPMAISEIRVERVTRAGVELWSNSR